VLSNVRSQLRAGRSPRMLIETHRNLNARRLGLIADPGFHASVIRPLQSALNGSKAGCRLVRAISLSDGASHVAARAAAFQVPAGDYADFASRWPNDQVAFVSGGRNASHLRTARELLTSTYDLVGKASDPAGLLDALRGLLRWPLWAQLATTATAGPAAGPAAPPFSLSEDEWATLRARAGSTMHSSPPFARVSSAAPLAEVRCASCHALICNIRGRLPRRRRRLPRPRGAGAPASA